MPWVSMTPLGSPVEPDGKDDGRQIVVLMPAKAHEPAFLHENPGHITHSSMTENASRGDALAEIVEVNNFDPRPSVERHFMREELRGDDRLDAALPDSRLYHIRRDGVIEVDRRLAERRQANVGNRPAGAGRQPNADHRLVFEQGAQALVEDLDADKRFTVFENGLRGIWIDQARAKGVPARHAARTGDAPGGDPSCGECPNRRTAFAAADRTVNASDSGGIGVPKLT